MIRLCSAAALLLFSSNSFGQSEVAATPQRPSFSTSVATTEAGWLEIESGVTFDDLSTVTPVTIKIGASENFEIFTGLTPFVDTGQDFEDITVGGRWRFREGTAGPSLAAQIYATTFRSSFADEMNYGFLFILSQGAGGVSLDLNAGLNLIDGGDEQIFGILTASKALSQKFSGYGEIFVRHTLDFDDQMVVVSTGGSYAVTPRFVLDGAINVNLANAGFDVQFLLGATTTLARLW